MARRLALAFTAIVALAPSLLPAQSTIDAAALQGLAPVTVLSHSSEGRAALGANLTVTGGIQTGTIRQATLLPFPQQQQQALRDAAITSSNLEQFADALGTTLGAAYVAHAHFVDAHHSTSISPAVQQLIAYAESVSGADSNAGKYLFANETTNGKTSVSPALIAIMNDAKGETDIFGKAYNLPAGSPGGGAYGDSRPFQTEPHTALITGPDFYDVPSTNWVYNHGPVMDLINSPSYPSGHTTYGYTGTLLLAILVPERYQQMITRGAEYGNDRILMGAHYAMDVMGGRTLALYDMAHMLANDPTYMNRHTRSGVTIPDFQTAVKAARADLTTILQTTCGDTLAACALADHSRFSNPAANQAFYADTQTYNLGTVYPQNANTLEDVARLAPEAGYLLTSAFPALTLPQADRILTDTEGPGGGFLDNGSAFGVYSRLNLYAAAGQAIRFSHEHGAAPSAQPAASE